MVVKLETTFDKNFSKPRNDFALAKIPIQQISWGYSKRRRAFYFECDNYRRKFGGYPPHEMFEVLWEHSKMWEDGVDFE